MKTEGRLKPFAPNPVTKRLTQMDVDLVVAAATRIDEYRGYKNRPDLYGRGYIKGAGIAGKMGEHVLCWFLNRRLGLSSSIDSALYRLGDGGKDLFVAEQVIQVKTRVTARATLVKRLDNRSCVKPLSCNLFVAARWRHARREVDLLGWVTATQARQRGRIERSPRDLHWNLVIDDWNLQPMSELVSDLYSRLP